MSNAPIAGLATSLAVPPQAAPARAATPAAAAALAPGQPAAQDDDGRIAQPDSKDLHAAVQKIEELVQPAARNLRFSIDEDTGTTVVKLIDTETQTVLRQIPTQEALEISKALDKLQGLLVKDKA